LRAIALLLTVRTIASGWIRLASALNAGHRVPVHTDAMIGVQFAGAAHRDRIPILRGQRRGDQLAKPPGARKEVSCPLQCVSEVHGPDLHCRSCDCEFAPAIDCFKDRVARISLA